MDRPGHHDRQCGASAVQRDLDFTQGDLTWVVNAFLVTFGSFLLLAGRLGNRLGRKRVFLAGVIVFTAASALCGVAPSQGFLIAARFVQGFGAAMQASVILAIIVTEFPHPRDRARPMGAYVFVAVAGGSLGLLAGGALTQALSWHWIFFVNLPIGIATIALGKTLIPRDNGLGLGHGVDWLGSILVTISLMTAVYAIVQATSHGWGRSRCSASAAWQSCSWARSGRPITDREPGHAPAHPPTPRSDRFELVRGCRDVLDVLSRHSVPRACSALQRIANRPWRSCPGR